LPTHHGFHPNKLVCASAWGVLDYDSVIEPLRALLNDDRFGPGYRFLVDFRELESFDLRAEDFVRINGEASESLHMIAGATTAVVVGSDVIFGMMRMYQQLATELPARMEIFRDFDEAREWIDTQ